MPPLRKPLPYTDEAPAPELHPDPWVNFHNGVGPRPEGIRHPPEHQTHDLACPRVKVSDCPVKIPTKFFEMLEQNQQLSSCCRHPENHDIIAFHSATAERTKDGRRVPDIYIFICDGCQRLHRRVMLGGGERIGWDIR